MTPNLSLSLSDLIRQSIFIFRIFSERTAGRYLSVFGFFHPRADRG